MGEQSDLENRKLDWKISVKQEDISESGDISSVYNNHYEILLNYGVQFNLDEASVQDCIHDLFVDLWRSGKSMDELDSVKAYLLRALKNKIFKKHKKKILNLEFDDKKTDSSLFPIEVSIEQAMINREDQTYREDTLNKEIRDLTPRQRELIYHIFYNGLSYEEASEILGISRKTAYNLVLKGINNLRKRIDLSNLSIILIFLPKIFQ